MGGGDLVPGISILAWGQIMNETDKSKGLPPDPFSGLVKSRALIMRRYNRLDRVLASLQWRWSERASLECFRTSEPDRGRARRVLQAHENVRRAYIFLDDVYG